MLVVRVSWYYEKLTGIIIPDFRHIVPVLTICRTHCPPVLPILRRLAGSPGRYHGAHHLEDNKLTRLTRRSLLVFEKSTSNTNQSFPVFTAQMSSVEKIVHFLEFLSTFNLFQPVTPEMISEAPCKINTSECTGNLIIWINPTISHSVDTFIFIYLITDGARLGLMYFILNVQNYSFFIKILFRKVNNSIIQQLNCLSCSMSVALLCYQTNYFIIS